MSNELTNLFYFVGAPGIISASPYAGAGFPPAFAIPQAGTVSLNIAHAFVVPLPFFLPLILDS